jgi:TonB family protein
MLIFPLSDGTKAFGILEVLSSHPNAFGLKDIEALKKLAQRIVESKSEAERGVAGLFSVEEHQSEAAPPAEKLPEKVVEIKPQGPIPVPTKSNIAIDDPAPAEAADLWTTVLVILVIVTAAALGLLLGGRYAVSKREASRIAAKPVSTTPVPAAQTPALPDRTEQVKQTREEVSRNQPDLSTTAPPPGGLLVTQNGRVIYRSQPGTQPSPAAPGTVIRSVEPQYPADARNQNIQGPVVLDVQVLRDGTVGTIGIVSGNPLLTKAAVHAVRQWKYQPNVVNGRTVESQTRVTINFTLPLAN